MIRRFADGAVTNNESDVFAFRMVSEDGRPVRTLALPELSLTIPAGHLGGTFVETPGRIGPWQTSSGARYFIMEPTETDNVLMVVRSEDAGRTWQEVDGANRPRSDDLEGLASVFVDGVIHILHQTSDHVWYHAFNTADTSLFRNESSTGDTWGITDDSVATPTEPPTQVAALAARSDGSLVAVYGGAQHLHYKIRSAEGIWGIEYNIEASAGSFLSGPQTVTGQDDVVHLAYSRSDGTGWYRQILPSGSLSDPVQLTNDLGITEYDVGAFLPLVYLSQSETVVTVYRRSDGVLESRFINRNGVPANPAQVSDRKVVQNAVDSDQVGADAIVASDADGDRVHLLFIEADTGSIYATNAGSDGSWVPAMLQIEGIHAQWVRGALNTNEAGQRVYGFVYDAGSNGGSGMNKYAELGLK